MKITKSFALQEKAKTLIPGISQLLSKRPDMFSYGVWPGYFSKAKGTQIWDLDNNQFTDMSISGIGANVLGYCDPEVDEAVMKAIRDGNSSSLLCPEDVELAELLCELHPWAHRVRYARSGGESMAIAVRIARAFTGKDIIAFCGYHGWHDWYLAANLGTENALGEHLISGLDPKGVPIGLKGTSIPFKFNDIPEITEIINSNKGKIAAIVMEPLRNFKPDEGYWAKLQQLAKENDILLIMDEISSGFRMNTGGAHLLFDIVPDIAVFSKALGNGYAIGAIIGKDKVMDISQSSFISSTYWTEKIGPSAAIAMIKKHKREDVGKHLVQIGESIQAGWKAISEKYGLSITIGGIPPLSYFAFSGEFYAHQKALFIQMMLENQILASSSFYSMYAHTELEVNQYLKIYDNIFQVISGIKSIKDLENLLKGKPSTSGFKRLN